MQTISEETAATVTVRFFDSSGTPKTPTGVEYRIDCDTSGVQIKGWTQVSAASVITIAVLPEENRIVNDRNRRERRVMTVKANTFTPLQLVTDEYMWFIRNGPGIT